MKLLNEPWQQNAGLSITVCTYNVKTHLHTRMTDKWQLLKDHTTVIGENSQGKWDARVKENTWS